MVKKFAYIRVSDKDQNEDRQLQAISNLGIPNKNIYIDKQSGKDFNRPRYKALIDDALREDDLLYIKSIDRLGRNYEEIKKEWEYITKTIKADIIVIDMPLLDTTRHKDLLGTFISDLILQVLAYVAENERNNIRQRQAEGIAVAKAKGKHLGRPKQDIDKAFIDVYLKWKDKDNPITAVKAMELLGMKRNTFYRRVEEYENNK